MSELDQEAKTWMQYVDDVAVVKESFAWESKGPVDPWRLMKDEFELSDFSGLVYIEKTALASHSESCTDRGNLKFAHQNADNEGIADRYDHALQDNDA